MATINKSALETLIRQIKTALNSKENHSTLFYYVQKITFENKVAEITTSLNNKADKTSLTQLTNTVNSKADASKVASLETAVNNKADTTTVNGKLDKTTFDALLNEGAVSMEVEYEDDTTETINILTRVQV